MCRSAESSDAMRPTSRDVHPGGPFVRRDKLAGSLRNDAAPSQ